jgi:ribosomal-protein-alanine N-acetyltransferase
MDPVLRTDRLVLRRLDDVDAAFLVELLNEPSFLRYIGDKNVRDDEGARRYLAEGPKASYARYGYGLLLVSTLEGEKAGMCGLLKRDWLPDPDIGFAFLPRFWSRGYAYESAAAVIDHGRRTWGVGRVAAITSPDNEPSIGLLKKLGFRFEREAVAPGGGGEVKVFASEPASAG